MSTNLQDGSSSRKLDVCPYAGLAAVQAVSIALPLLRDTKTRACHTMPFVDMIKETISNRALIWLISEADELVGVAFTRIVTIDEKRCLNFLYARSSKSGVSMEALDAIMDWAKNAGIELVEFEGRSGLGRWWPGRKPTVVSTVYRMEIV